MKIIVAATLLALTACSQSTGVLKLGPDTYTVSVHSAPAAGGKLDAKKKAIVEANNYCTTQHKDILITNTYVRASSGSPGGDADITFRCLDSGDKDLVRPVYEKPADIVVDVK